MKYITSLVSIIGVAEVIATLHEAHRQFGGGQGSRMLTLTVGRRMTGRGGERVADGGVPRVVELVGGVTERFEVVELHDVDCWLRGRVGVAATHRRARVTRRLYAPLSHQ